MTQCFSGVPNCSRIAIAFICYVGWLAPVAAQAPAPPGGGGVNDASTSFGVAKQASAAVEPLWYQGSGADDPALVENATPFPSSKVIVSAQWTTPRYYPNPNLQAADIIPVTWASDGDTYVMGDDGTVHGVEGTTLISRILGDPPLDNSVPKIDFELVAHDTFLYGCPKSKTANSCYSVGFTNVENVFYAATFDKAYPIPGDHPPGNARMEYSASPMSQTSWIHGAINFPKPVDSGTVSFVEIGKGAASHDGCPTTTFPRGCIFALVSAGGYQDPDDPNGMDQFIATQLYLARMAVGTPEQQYKEVVDPLRWQWFAGYDSGNNPTWFGADSPQLPQVIRSLSYPRAGRAGCTAGDKSRCSFWGETEGHAGHMNYPHMAYDAALDRYLLSFTDLYYRDFLPATERGPMVQGGAEAIVLEAPHPWGPWSFLMRSPYLGSGTGYGPSFPIKWQGAGSPDGQDLWMIWAANFFKECGTPRLVPEDRCQGVYGMNLRRLHLSRAGSEGSLDRPWYDQEIGFASPGSASVHGNVIQVSGNGNLAKVPDPFDQFKDKLYHDAFHYVFQRVNGDGAIEARLKHPPNAKGLPGPDASVGLMIRDTTYVVGRTKDALEGKNLSSGDVFSEDARYAYVGVRNDGAVFFQYRDEGHVVRSKMLPGKCLKECALKISLRHNTVAAVLSAGDQAAHEVDVHTFKRPLSGGGVTIGMVAASDSVSSFPQYAVNAGEFSSVQVARSESGKP